MSTPTAAFPTTWVTRSVTPPPPSPCWISGSANSTLVTTALRNIRCSWLWPKPCASSTFRSTSSPTSFSAFRQDQTVTTFETFNDLLAYCRYSANPVGHLVLYLCGYRDLDRQHLSDFTCTALQLANFWQDVSVDYEKGRIYLPLEDLRRFNVSQRDIADHQNTPAFCAMMEFEVERARDWFRQGLPLTEKVNSELAIDLDLFSRGGQEILNAIEKQNYAVLGNRPAISKPRKLALVARAAVAKLLGNRVGGKR